MEGGERDVRGMERREGWRGGRDRRGVREDGQRGRERGIGGMHGGEGGERRMKDGQMRKREHTLSPAVPVAFVPSVPSFPLPEPGCDF